MISSQVVLSPHICRKEVKAFEFGIILVYTESNPNKTTGELVCVRQEQAQYRHLDCSVSGIQGKLI